MVLVCPDKFQAGQDTLVLTELIEFQAGQDTLVLTELIAVTVMSAAIRSTRQAGSYRP